MKTIADVQVMISDVFATHGRYRSSQEAVVCGDTRRAWGEFDANINRVANALLARGIGKGDRVAVMMGNAVEMLEIVFGVVRAGACVVPLSGLLSGAQLAALLNDSGAVLGFATADFIERLGAKRDGLASMRDDGFVAVCCAAPGWQPFDDFLGSASKAMPQVVLRPDDDFNIIYSSGTTGLPKGIVQSHRARTHWAFSNAIEMGFRDTSRALTTTPLYSNGTWLMMLPVLFCGGTCVVMPTFDPQHVLEALVGESITHTFMVPAQYTAVLDVPAAAGATLAALQVLLCAGSPLRRDTKRRVIERFGNRLIELYGFSEGFATMLKPHHPAAKFDTVGVPVLGFEACILDEAGHVLPRGETGEIAGYGAGMMSRYHNQPDATAALIWHDDRGRSFIRSGDIGRQDEDGFLVLVDRKKDLIISGGFNIFPVDIEEVVGRHCDVQDVTVIGIPHERWGETPLALVIPRAGTQADSNDILAWANERLARHQRLFKVELREDFPRNALGKVLKRVLREPWWS